MKSSEDGACSNEIARAFKETYEFTEIGNLTIMKNPQFLDDLSQISEQYTAFQGSFIQSYLRTNFYYKCSDCYSSQREISN